jgi:putative transposase
LPARVVIETLQVLFLFKGTPLYLRSDNGPEFIARKVQAYPAQHHVQTRYIAPGCPWQNAYGESFNDKLRVECLNRETFRSLEEAKWMIENWRRQYNQFRPHSSLGYHTPMEFAAGCNVREKESDGLCSLTLAISTAGTYIDGSNHLD